MNTAVSTILCQPLRVEQVSLYAIPGLMRQKTKIMARIDPVAYLEALIETACNVCRVTRKQVMGPSRYREIVTCRYLVMYMLRQNTNLSLKQIGHMLNRDHTTVIHAIVAVNNWIYTNDPAAGLLDEIKMQL